jgi:hypothetical protein
LKGRRTPCSSAGFEPAEKLSAAAKAAAATNAAGAFPLTPGSTDATVAPASGAGGSALLEIYDLDD